MAAYASSNSATGTGSAVVTKPTGLAAGDLMVAAVCDTGASGTPSTPSGWTEMSTTTDGNGKTMTVYAKIADSGDAGATNFTFSHSNGAAVVGAIMHRITGTLAAANNIYAIVSQNGSEPSADVFRFATGITPYVASSLLIMFVSVKGTGNNIDDSNISSYSIETSNPSWTEQQEVLYGTGGNGHRLATATATRVETTGTGYYQSAVTIVAGEDATDGLAVLLAITDTSNGTHNATVITSTAEVQAPAASGGSQTSPAVVTMTSAVQAPTVTGGTNDALWTNTDKPSPGSLTNTDKP